MYRHWGRNISARRKALKMSQYDLADAVGVRQPTIWRWENAKAIPRVHHMVKVAEVLRVDVPLLFPMVGSGKVA